MVINTYNKGNPIIKEILLKDWLNLGRSSATTDIQERVYGFI